MNRHEVILSVSLVILLFSFVIFMRINTSNSQFQMAKYGMILGFGGLAYSLWEYKKANAIFSAEQLEKEKAAEQEAFRLEPTFRFETSALVDLNTPNMPNLKSLLNQNVTGDETVSVALAPMQGQAFVATDRRIIIVDTGMVGQMVKSYPYKSISSIECSWLDVVGGIKCRVPGSKDENLVTFADDSRERMEQAALKAQELLEGADREKAAPKSNESEDIPHKLKQLAELKEQGILSEEEFATKKAELLQRM